MQVTCFFEAMIAPMPPEMSQVKLPTLVCAEPWANPADGAASPAMRVSAARALRGLCISNSFFRDYARNNAELSARVPRAPSAREDANNHPRAKTQTNCYAIQRCDWLMMLF